MHFADHAALCFAHQFLHFFGTVDKTTCTVVVGNVISAMVVAGFIAVIASVVVAGFIAVVSLVSLMELAPVLDFML